MKSGNAEIHNSAGLFGAYASGFLNDLFGIGALLWPLVFAALGAAYISAKWSMPWWRWCGFFLLTLCLLMAASSFDMAIGDLSGGGVIGNTLYFNGKRFLSPLGSFLLWLFIFLAGLQLACNISWFNLAARVSDKIKLKLTDLRGENSPKQDVLPQTEDREGNVSSPLQAFKNMGQTLKEVFGKLSRKNGAAALEINLDAPAAEMAMPIPAKLEIFPKKEADEEDEEPFALSEDLRDPDLPLMEQPPAGEIPPQVKSAGADRPEPANTAPARIGIAGAPPPPSAPLPAADKPINPPSKAREPEKKSGPCPGPRENLLEKARRAPLPSLDLLKPQPPEAAISREDLEAKGLALMTCFKDFDIQGDLARITPGPVVTMFEMRPAAGIRVSKIANLGDDLSLALKAVAVRIQAPIPGTDTVGIEIPNEKRETVNFRQLAASGEFAKGCGPLTMILGKDIAGRPYMADLTRMPHLLVAGATGAGKSVCLNSILVSLLYHSQPDETRLLLIDPKRIEMAAYADLPHLVHPVVTEMSDAKNALDWAVHEMESRYKAVARLGVRNVAAYNHKLAAFKDNLPPDYADLRPLPYLVIVIDELADLMMTAAREVETSIVRLAQLARAAGIHMILATQRPSVDVVTGLIKANFPCRISFQVTSKHDSRTILDQVGAEHLLGRGDMLYKPSGGRLLRLHGPFLSDEEVAAVVNHWKSYLKPSYSIDFSQWSPENSKNSVSSSGDATADPLYADAKAFVLGQDRASISLLQRHLKIGYNRSARLMEQFEREGIIGPADGSNPRNVIR